MIKMGLAHPPLSPVGFDCGVGPECSAPLFFDASFHRAPRPSQTAKHQFGGRGNRNLTEPIKP
jgi:hypothetical protein